MRRALFVLPGSHWSIIATIKAVIWAVLALEVEEKALASSEISDVAVVASEGGQWTSSNVML